MCCMFAYVCIYRHMQSSLDVDSMLCWIYMKRKFKMHVERGKKGCGLQRYRLKGRRKERSSKLF